MHAMRPALSVPVSPARLHVVEGIARVVAIDAGVAWLEPEQTGSCGGCASAASCGDKGIGTIASRIAARRFPLHNPAGLVVGERVVVGVGESALLKASLTAYALPLALALVAGGVAQSIADSDGITMAAMAAGMAIGLAAARLGARRLSAQGELAPRFLRRAVPGETCGPQ
jgi:sigma-E factor negative regulatory protein RseC